MSFLLQERHFYLYNIYIVNAILDKIYKMSMIF